MPINFPDTANAPTDGSFTHIHLDNTWVWNGISWSIQNIISTYTDSDVDTHLNKTSSITNGHVLSWDASLNSNQGDYAWVEQTSGSGTNYADSDVDTHLNKTSTSGYVLSWDQTLNGGLGDYAWIPNTNQTLGVMTSLPTDGHVLSWDSSANNNQGGYAWVPQSGGTSGGGSSVSIAETAPSSPSSGDLWWDSSNGNLKIYYTDANSSQWVDTYATQASSGGGGSSSSSSITDGTSTLSFDSNNNISVNTHFIPDTNASYDLGSAEYKIRHLFLSDNSLWIGDDHKIDTSDGTFKTRKRKKDSIPNSVLETYRSSFPNATAEDVGEAAILWINQNIIPDPLINLVKEITLQMWIKYLNSLDSTKTNIQDLYPPEYLDGVENNKYKPEDYDEIIHQRQEGKKPALILNPENGVYNLPLFNSKRMVIINPTSEININVIGAEPIDGNTVEFTVYVKQDVVAQDISLITIDEINVVPRIVGHNQIDANQVNIYDIKLVYLGGYWFGTAFRG